MFWNLLKSEPWILIGVAVVALIILLNVIVTIYHAFLPKAGTGEVKKGESSDYTINDLNK